MAGAQLSQLAMGTTDVAFVGRLQGEALAAMTVGQAAYGFFLMFGIGILAAVGPLVSQAYGAQKDSDTAIPVVVGCWCALLCSLLAWLFLWPIDVLFGWLEYDPRVIAKATSYTRAVMLGLPACFIYLTLKNYADSISRPRIPFLVAVCGIFVNGVADYALIFGRWGFPNLGVMGTGLATSIVNVFMMIALIALLWKPEFSKALFRTRILDFREFLSIGLPIAASTCLEVGLFVVAALMMGKLGTSEAAAHQIVLVCAATTFMVPLGISFAGGTRVGQAIGAKNFAGVRPAGLAAIGVGTAFMVMSALLFMLVPGPIVDLFWTPTSEGGDSVRNFAIELLFIAGVFQIFDGLQVTAGGALRGMKDVKIPLAIAVASYWIVGLTTASYLAFYTPLRHRGLWLGLLAGLGCAAVGLLLRFLILSRRLTEDPDLQAKAQEPDLLPHFPLTDAQLPNPLP